MALLVFGGALALDEERRQKSPGIANNFWDVPQEDFKKPYGGPADPSLWPIEAERAKIEAWLNLLPDDCDNDDCVIGDW